MQRYVRSWGLFAWFSVLVFVALPGCGQGAEAEPLAGYGGDMPLSPSPISWPLTGGLDTDTGPLSVVPGSHLELSDIVQERKDEWRNRNGFTVDAQDALPNGIAPLIGKLGDAGLFAQNEQLATYQPSLASNRWTTAPFTDPIIADDISRVPVMTSDNPIFGFAQTGNLYLVASLDSMAPALALFDAQGKTHAKVSLTTGLYLRARCAATATKLVAYLADTSGNLVVYVVDAGTGVVTGPTTLKTGLHVTLSYVDALWDGISATITVVARLASADAVRFMEHNPATGALATDASLSGVTVTNALSLNQDVSASGTRFVGVSESAGPSTRMLRVSSAGSVLQNDLLVAGASSAITGVGYQAGTFYSVVYERAGVPLGNEIDISWRAGIGLQGPVMLAPAGSTILMSIDGQGWSANGTTWQFLVGYHSTVTTDPQDSWVIMAVPFGSGRMMEQSRIAPLQAQALMLGPSGPLSTWSALFQRTTSGTDASKFALPVLASYVLSGGVAKRQYSIDVFTQQILGKADIGATVNHGSPVPYKQTSFVPANSASFIDEGILFPIGVAAPPPQPSGFTQMTGGGLTATDTYQYVDVLETIDSDGNIWRSPPSVPTTIVLTGGNNQIQRSDVIRISSRPGLRFRIKTYRSQGNGSVFRLINITPGNFTYGTTIVINDVASDASINQSEILYTTGELSTAITPRFSHMATFGDRLWGINADFRTEIWPSKNLRPGRQPEFVEEGVLDIDDNYGDITGIVGLDGNGVVFKRTAVYFVTGDGLTDAGSGQTHTSQQVATGIGAIPGSPVVTAGDVVFFVTDRGIYSIDRGANLAYIGAGVDKYFNQPLIATPETVFDGVFMPKQNEVRFVTTNYILVYDLKYKTWTRWNLAGFRRCLNINDRMVLFKGDGTVWREGDQTVTTDNGTPYNGIIRSAWVRPTAFGQIRLYRGLVLGTRTPGGSSITPTMQIFEDNSDVQTQSFSPSTAVPGAQAVIQAEARPQRQNCSTFSLQVTLPASDITFRLAKWGAEIGVRQPRAQKRSAGAGESWQ